MSAVEPLTPFGAALAGALGSVFANAVVYPLDTVKTRVQAGAAEAKTEKTPAKKSNKSKIQLISMLMKIVQEEGVTGLFKGFNANMLNTFAMQFAYFFFHSWLRGAALKRSPEGLGTGSELALGAGAGAFAQIFTIPVAVVATRQQLWVAPPGAKGKAAREPSLLETAQEIVRDGGVTALWTGLKPGLVLTVNPAITYGVFERCKSLLLSGPREGGKLGVGEAFWMGVLSKTLATIVTYPYIMAKVRLQAKVDKALPEGESYDQALHEGKNVRPKGAIDLLKQVYHDRGFGGWYEGLGAQIFKAVLCQGILFVTKEKFEDQARIIMRYANKLTTRAIA